MNTLRKIFLLATWAIIFVGGFVVSVHAAAHGTNKQENGELKDVDTTDFESITPDTYESSDQVLLSKIASSAWAFSEVMSIENDRPTLSKKSQDLLAEIEAIEDVQNKKVIQKVFLSKVCCALLLNKIDTYDFEKLKCQEKTMLEDIKGKAETLLQRISNVKEMLGEIEATLSSVVKEVSSKLIQATEFVCKVRKTLDLAGGNILVAKFIGKDGKKLTIPEYVEQVSDICKQEVQNNFLQYVFVATRLVSEQYSKCGARKASEATPDRVGSRMKTVLNKKFTEANRQIAIKGNK